MTLESLALDIRVLAEPGGLLDQLQALLPEPVADPTTGTTGHHKTIGSPAPWHVEAATALMDIHEGARRLEASLRRDTAGRLGDRRGCSDTNTRYALKAIPRLAEALDDEHANTAARIVARWVTTAQQIRDLDEADPWKPLPRLPGSLPPACDHCGAYSLRHNPRTGAVRCATPGCVDADGRRPEATMQVGAYSGVASLVWRDGRSVNYRTPERV